MCDTLCFVFLQDGDLAAAENCLEGETDEEFSGRGEEGAEGVGGGGEDGVDA